MQLFFAILCKNVNELFNSNTNDIPHKIFDDECLPATVGWNRKKKSYTFLTTFFMSTWWMDCKYIYIYKSQWLFELIHIIRFEMRMDSRINLKIFLGYDINYLCTWPFMRHPWFPTRKASKLTFICFQLAGWWPCDCFQLAGWCHSPASWKQTNVSFEAFLVGNQGWRIKSQMLT